ncbi:toll/interleukin-1 receptor domain-containing protein [Flavobacterium sp. 3HN19-14]|uniref:toll/interleukin-1 receptor domain-containing protein n=1 Tax=Flavobacterium sp. 3HN19-14 TaxID=3448133 RepID=UPI003EE30B82
MEKKVFITYSWDNDSHKDWVRHLADKLIESGIDVFLDQYDIAPGESFTQFMEKSIEESDKVLVILTPTYRKKSLNRNGGVGYEQQIISGEIMYGINRKKFIPLLVEGSYDNDESCAIPTHFKGIATIDFRQKAEFDAMIEILVRTIYEKPKLLKPEKGKNPYLTSPEIKTFHIPLDGNFIPIQDEILMMDMYSQISDYRKLQKPYKIEFKIEEVSEIHQKYLSLCDRSDLSTDEIRTKLNYREWLNSNFFWGTSNIYEKLQSAMENIIDLSFEKFHYLNSINDLTTCINSCFKLFSANQYNLSGRSFDVFNNAKNWSFKIYLGDDEVQKLLSVFGIKEKFEHGHSMLLSALGGLDVFDLYPETLKFQAIPRQAYRYTYDEFYKRINIDEKEEYFNIGTWKIGLA